LGSRREKGRCAASQSSEPAIAFKPTAGSSHQLIKSSTNEPRRHRRRAQLPNKLRASIDEPASHGGCADYGGNRVSMKGASRWRGGREAKGRWETIIHDPLRDDSCTNELTDKLEWSNGAGSAGCGRRGVRVARRELVTRKQRTDTHSQIIQPCQGEDGGVRATWAWASVLVCDREQNVREEFKQT
jgi:hypothetical protein